MELVSVSVGLMLFAVVVELQRPFILIRLTFRRVPLRFTMSALLVAVTIALSHLSRHVSDTYTHLEPEKEGSLDDFI